MGPSLLDSKTPSPSTGFECGLPAMTYQPLLSPFPSDSQEFPSDHVPSLADGSMSPFMDSESLPSFPQDGDGPSSGNAPSIPCNPAAFFGNHAQEMQMPWAASDRDCMLTGLDSQLHEPVARSGHNGTSGSANPSVTHITLASTGVAATSAPSAGQSASPTGIPPWHAHSLVSHNSEIMGKSSWASCGAELLDRSLQAFAHGKVLAHEISSTLSPHAEGRQDTAARAGTTAAPTSAGQPMQKPLHQDSFPMQHPSEQGAQTIAPNPAPQLSKPVHGPRLQGAHPQSPQGRAPRPCHKEGQSSNIQNPALEGAHPHSPAGSLPEWSHQQDLLGDWDLGMPAACNTSAALVNNAMLESLDMQDLPGFLSAAVQPQAGANVAAWDCSTTSGPSPSSSNRRANRLLFQNRHPPASGPPASQPPIPHSSSISQAVPLRIAVRPPSFPPTIPMPRSSIAHPGLIASGPAVRPHSQPLIPITTGGRRGEGQLGIPGAMPNHVGAGAIPDVFNILSLDSFEHLQQKGGLLFGKAGALPTSHADPQQQMEWSGLGSGAPAVMGSNFRPEGLRMSASDIGDFHQGMGPEACAHASPSPSLRRSARAPKPLRPIGEEDGDGDGHDDDDDQSRSAAEELEFEEAETPPSKRSKGNSGASNSAGQHQPRRRAGRPILPVKNPSGGALTQEQMRLVRRRMHNRESARRSRGKRQAVYEEQSDKVKTAMAAARPCQSRPGGSPWLMILAEECLLHICKIGPASPCHERTGIKSYDKVRRPIQIVR
ncbi:hypothetical protein WJX74_000963 [Apatococcus lobatus]|uniref:BZIP domain-containing protein n=1 Tax=Apatococcus lobatus TaxID=904363 RepID=A0AAW1RL07_9CHLO